MVALDREGAADIYVSLADRPGILDMQVLTGGHPAIPEH